MDRYVQQIYSAALTDTEVGSTCRDILLSMWDDGTRYGCDLTRVVSLDNEIYSAVRILMDHFHTSGQQLADFLSTKQIARLQDEIFPAENTAESEAEGIVVLDLGKKFRSTRF